LNPNTDSPAAGLVETNATTQFIADKNIVVSSPINVSLMDKITYDSSSDKLNQEIKDFLAKPVIVMTNTLSSGDTFSTFPLLLNPLTTFSNSTMMTNKVDGFLGFRATTVYRLVVNANRFQQGRYNMSYVALGGADYNVANNSKWVSDHLSTLVQRTTLPHVEVDLCCDTEAILRVPFNSALNFFPFRTLNVASDTGTWGALSFYPYVPLAAAAGNLTCGFTIYSHFEDVELVVAALPQSSRNATFSKKTKNATEFEQDSSDIGPISSSLIRVRDFSAILAQVPLLSSYALTTSWFADIAANAAKVFGWSKPISLAPSMRVTQNYLPYSANTDGPDMSFPLSLSYENSVGMAKGFSGTDVDEMDFTFLCTIPVYAVTIPWASASVAGTVLHTTPVTPLANVVTTTVNGTSFSHFSPLQLIAQHFFYWRGSMVYKIKLVKTEFHSGRLLVAFSPIDPNLGASSGVTIANSVYLHRQIIDVRETNEFTFIVPFVSTSPYLIVDPTLGAGTFAIIVLEPLVAPTTVASTISIIIEKASGPDIEFSGPVPTTYTYYTGISPQSGGGFSSLDVPYNVCSNMSSTIGVSALTDDKSLNALHCIGEKVSSFRTLLKLPTQLVPFAAPTPNTYLNVSPFLISSGTVVGITNTPPTVINDIYSRLASCYTYSRGSVRIKFLDNTAVTNTAPISITLALTNGLASNKTGVWTYSAANPYSNTNSTTRVGVPVMYYRAGYSGEVQVPQYHRYHSRLNSDCVGNAADWYYNIGSGIAPRVFISRASIPSANLEASVLRSGGDDVNFGLFLSVPPMTALFSQF